MLSEKARSVAKEFGITTTTSSALPTTADSQKTESKLSPPFANWERIDGDGLRGFEPGHIVCKFIDDKDWLPEEFKKIKTVIAENEVLKANEPDARPAWAGRGFGVVSFYPSRTELERPKLFLTFKPTDYFDFLATNLLERVYLPQNPRVADRIAKDLNGPELVRQYSSRVNPKETPIPEFANHFSIGMTVLTSDDPQQMVIVERTKRSSRQR